MRIISVVGARPNFIKIASLCSELSKHGGIEHVLVHTGQHYDESMSRQFFSKLEIPRPDINLEVGSGSHAVQTAEIMRRFEPILLENPSDLVIVVGDVNSTLASALVAKKLGVDVAHIEAGLRSFDRSMPEEINRLLTDAIADLHFTTEPSAEQNLVREGVERQKIFFVGNLMIDTLMAHRAKAENSKIRVRLGLDLRSGPYGVVTLHRPENVDGSEHLGKLLEALQLLAARIRLVFPMHPRTRRTMEAAGLERYQNLEHLLIIDPLGYLDFLNLMSQATLVITDSGGIQEETTVLGIPCLTIRDNTERPVTVEQGTNQLVGTDPRRLLEAAIGILENGWKPREIPTLWDGRAAERIVKVLLQRYDSAPDQ